MIDATIPKERAGDVEDPSRHPPDRPLRSLANPLNVDISVAESGEQCSAHRRLSPPPCNGRRPNKGQPMLNLGGLSHG